MEVLLLLEVHLRVLGWYIALFLKIIWSDLSNVQIDQVCIVAIDLHQLVLVVTINVNVITHIDMLMR